MRLNLLTFVCVDGAGIFIFSVMFQLAFNTDAHPWSPTGQVALARTARLSVVALPLEEPPKDLSTPHVGSLIGVHSNFAFCFTDGIGASPEWSEMIRNIERRVFFEDTVAEPTCSPLDQSGLGIHQPVRHAGAK